MPFDDNGSGLRVNPYTDITNVMFGAFANMPRDWWAAGTNWVDDSEKDYMKAESTDFKDSEDYLFFAENCREMIKMEKIEGTLKAELYREIGEFDKCIECLDSLEPAKEYENKVRSQIRLMAENKQKEVFLLNK